MTEYKARAVADAIQALITVNLQHVTSIKPAEQIYAEVERAKSFIETVLLESTQP